MAMSWETTRGGAGEPAGEMHTVTEHWYLTEDRTRVVREGDPAGRWLWASPGTAVLRADALRYGALVEEPEPVEEAPVAEPEPEGIVGEQGPELLTMGEDAEVVDEKKAKPAANKAAKKATNKAADKAEDK